MVLIKSIYFFLDIKPYQDGQNQGNQFKPRVISEPMIDPVP
jgi:hypothetical protein